MKFKGLSLRIIFFLVLTDIVESVVMFCFKKMAASNIPAAEYHVSGLATALQGVITSPYLWIFLICIILSFVIWSAVLSEIDLSVAFPLASLSFIFVPLVSIFFLHEHVGFWRWLGIAFITVGIIWLSESTQATTSEKS